MPRISGRSFRSNGTGAKAADRDSGRRTLSAELTSAQTVEERRDAFVERLQLDREQPAADSPSGFEADCEKVGGLLERNDLDGLLKHGGRHTRERAEAHAAAIRSGH